MGRSALNRPRTTYTLAPLIRAAFFFAGTNNYDFALLRKDVTDKQMYEQARVHAANGVKVRPRSECPPGHCLAMGHMPHPCHRLGLPVGKILTYKIAHRSR